MLTRRQVLFAGAAALGGCSRRDPPHPTARPAPVASAPAPRPAPSAALASDAAPAPSAPRAPLTLKLDTWRLPSPIERAVLMIPENLAPGERLPVVVALHGRGEARKGPEAGSLGWPHDYELVRAYERLSSPPLRPADFEGLVEPSALAAMNRALALRPFRGVAVLCPYVPDLDLDSAKDQEAYGRALVDVLLPRAKREPSLRVEPASTGIDGVSLGGAVALRAGLGHPEAFGAVGTLQPAIHTKHVAGLTALAKAARAARPGLKLRLTTSHEDYFLEPTRRLSEAWRAAGIDHDFAELPGPHDYVFNRGPGAITLLDWQDRALHGD